MILEGYPLGEIVYSEALHFASSACAGLLAWWSISTILHHGTEASTSRRSSLRSALSWSFALFIALLTHVIVDIFDWF